MNIKKFQEQLSYFTGTTSYSRYYDLLLTDGSVFFAQETETFWIIDIVYRVLPLLKQEPFVVITLTQTGTKAIIQFDDGDKGTGTKVLYQQKLGYSSCPEGVWKWYLADGVLMLPSEY